MKRKIRLMYVNWGWTGEFEFGWRDFDHELEEFITNYNERLVEYNGEYAGEMHISISHGWYHIT